MKVLEVWIRVSLIWHFDNFFCFFYLSNLLVALVYNFGTWSLVFNGFSTMMQVIQGWLWTEFHEKNFLIYNFFWISFSDLNFWKFSTFLQWRQLHINSRRIVSAIRFLFRFCLAFLSKLRNFSTDHRSTFNFRLQLLKFGFHSPSSMVIHIWFNSILLLVPQWSHLSYSISLFEGPFGHSGIKPETTPDPNRPNLSDSHINPLSVTRVVTLSILSVGHISCRSWWYKDFFVGLTL